MKAFKRSMTMVLALLLLASCVGEAWASAEPAEAEVPDGTEEMREAEAPAETTEDAWQSAAAREQPPTEDAEPALDGETCTITLDDGSTHEVSGMDLSLASHHKYYTYETYAQAYQADAFCKYYADEIMRQFGDQSELYRVSVAAQIVARYSARAEYDSDSAGHYRSPYGVFCAGVYTCAGSTRALGRILDYMGFSWTHANENQNEHQWCELVMDGKEGLADGMGGFAYYYEDDEEPDYKSFGSFEELKALCEQTYDSPTYYRAEGDITIDSDLHIPQNLIVHVTATYRSYRLAILDGVTVTADGVLLADDWNRGGSFVVGESGYVEIHDSAFWDDDLISWYSTAEQYAGISTQRLLFVVTVYIPIIVSGELEIPENLYLRLRADTSLTVPKGAVLVNRGRIIPEVSEDFDVETWSFIYSAAKFLVEGTLVNDGVIEVPPGGELRLSDSGSYIGNGYIVVDAMQDASELLIGLPLSDFDDYANLLGARFLYLKQQEDPYLEAALLLQRIVNEDTDATPDRSAALLKTAS